MKSFNIDTQTTPVADYAFAGNQAARAQQTNSTRVFRFRYIQGDVQRIPGYMWDAFRAAGLTPHYLGGTTYRHSVIGLATTTAEDLRHRINRVAIQWQYPRGVNIQTLRAEINAAAAMFPELRDEFSAKFAQLLLEAANV